MVMKRNSLFTAFCVLTFWANAQTLTIQSGSTVYTNSSGSASTLNVMGSIQNSGNLTIEGGISSNQDLIINGTLNVPLSGATLGSGYDQINITGTATLTGGTLNVTLANGYMPTSGSTYTIIDGTSLIGNFSSQSLPALSGGLTWSTSYNGSAGTVILSVSAVLPVELLDFKAMVDNKRVLLDWQTALEQNTESFTLERSRNGQNFSPLSTTKAKGSNSFYNDADEQPFTGINYYRLKMTDKDGQTSYSKVVSAIMGDKTLKIKVYPSLVTDVLTVTTDGGLLTDIQIINMAGQIILNHSKNLINDNTIRIDLSDLPQAIYLVRAQNSEGVVATTKIVKQ